MTKPFTIDQTWLRCIACGHKADLLDERKFQCPLCGGLYDVEHDFQGLYSGKNFTFGYLTRMFDLRYGQANCFALKNAIHRSGIWRFKELVMPYLPDEHIVTLGEGNVPIVQAGRHLREWVGLDDLWLILEGMTPTGSFKDFGGTVMMSIAKAAGIKAVGCASTGDTSAMLAAYAGAAGLDCVVVLPEGKVTPAQLAQPLVHGAKVITIPGVFDECMRVVKELVNQGRIFPGNSLNPTRIEGHQATVFLLAQFFGWELPDWIALPVGNGSNCSSVGKAMRTMKQLGFEGKTSQILGCQSAAAYPLAASFDRTVREQLGKMENVILSMVGGSPFTEDDWRQNYVPQDEVGETNATAALIGKPVSWQKVIREITQSNGQMNIAPEALLNEAVGICGRDGYFVCPQTGTALAGVKLAVQNGIIRKGARVAVVSTANGLKFTESAAKDLEPTIIRAKTCETEEVADIIGV